MSKQPFLPLFFGDLLASTATWDGEERALYVLLLAYQWTSGPLPKDMKRIARMCQYDLKNFTTLWETVGRKFVEGEEGLINLRLEDHRDRSNAIAEKRAKAGAKGGAITQAKGKQLLDEGSSKQQANAQANDSDLLGHPSHPIPSHPNPELKSKNSESSLSSQIAAQTDFDDAVQQVFDHWRREWNHPDAKLDPKRTARIKARLKNFTIEKICKAISGFKHSDWHTGRDPKGGGKIYDKIETLLREDSQVEEGLRLYTHPPQAPPDPRLMSAVERVRLANGTEVKRDERVVSEQNGQRFGDLDLTGGDVRQPPNTGLRRFGS